jgi:hypothetical protein
MYMDMQHDTNIKNNDQFEAMASSPRGNFPPHPVARSTDLCKSRFVLLQKRISEPLPRIKCLSLNQHLRETLSSSLHLLWTEVGRVR